MKRCRPPLLAPIRGSRLRNQEITVSLPELRRGNRTNSRCRSCAGHDTSSPPKESGSAAETHIDNVKVEGVKPENTGIYSIPNVMEWNGLFACAWTIKSDSILPLYDGSPKPTRRSATRAHSKSKPSGGVHLLARGNCGSPKIKLSQNFDRHPAHAHHHGFNISHAPLPPQPRS